MKSVKVYGIKNCGTVKKALNWLTENNIEFEFHDYKKSGIQAEKIQQWQSKLPWESLINKRGTTWRKLSPQTQDGVVDAVAAEELMLAHSSLIKRPIIEAEDTLLTGFDESEYEQQLLK